MYKNADLMFLLIVKVSQIPKSPLVDENLRDNRILLCIALPVPVLVNSQVFSLISKNLNISAGDK